MSDDDDIDELSFDDAVRSDPRSVRQHIFNALNELHFALHKTTNATQAVPIVNAIAILEAIEKQAR